MKITNVNGSIMALVLATSAAATAVPQKNIAGLRQPSASSFAEKKYTLFQLALPARFNDSEKGFLEGHVFLSLTKSKLRPESLNLVTAEYEGLFYFESNAKVYDDYPLHVSLAGEDDNIILDLVHSPSHDGDQTKVYNMHGCNSTKTSCEPVAMQFRVREDGTTDLKGTFVDGLEVFKDGAWIKQIYFVDLVKEEIKK